MSKKTPSALDLVRCHITYVYEGRELLGEVVGVRKTEEGEKLLVKHFNGEFWPVEPKLDSVVIIGP